MQKNIYLSKNQNYQYEQGQSGKKISENNPYYQRKYDSFTPRKRYMKEHEEYDNYRSSHIQKNNTYRECQPIIRQEQGLRTSRNKRNSNLIQEQYKSYDAPQTLQYSQKIVEKYSKDLFQFNDSDILKENTQKYVNKTTSRKQKLKNIAIDKDICRNLNLVDEQINEKNNIRWSVKNMKESVQRKRQVEVDQNICLTPRRLNKMKQQTNNQYIVKMTNLQNKITRLQKMTPKRSSTPKHSRIIESSSYNPTPQKNKRVEVPSYIPPPQTIQHIQYRQQDRYDSTSNSRLSLASSRQMQIMSRVSLGRLVEQQQAQTQVQMIQSLSNKISSKLQSIIRNFG